MAEPAAALLREGFTRMVRAGLRGVWLDGLLPAGPFVWAANHHSWWDPFVAAAVLRRERRAACLVMAGDNLARFDFVRRLGVFGTAEPRAGLQYLAAGRVLVIFPEGELRPAGPPGPLATGAAWFAARASVPLVAAAVRLAMRGHQSPEAYVTVAPVAAAGTIRDTTGRLSVALTTGLSTIDRQLSGTDPRRAPAGFRLVVAGRRSWDERIETMAAWWPWRA